MVILLASMLAAPRASAGFSWCEFALDIGTLIKVGGRTDLDRLGKVWRQIREGTYVDTEDPSFDPGPIKRVDFVSLGAHDARVEVVREKMVASRRGKPARPIYTSAFYNISDMGFEETRKFYPNGGHTTSYQPFASPFAPGALRGKRILDLGAGRGRFVQELRDRLGLTENDLSVVGVDLILQSTPESSRPYFYAMDAANLEPELPRESFDLVFSTRAIFTYDSKQWKQLGLLLQSFKAAHEVLKPGGTLWISPVHQNELYNLWDHHLRDWFEEPNWGISQLTDPKKEGIANWMSFRKRTP
jgi:SAM-dependent methyltransferase